MRKRVAALAALACASPAAADSWVGVEAPFAIATSPTQRDLFQPGFLPAAGFYLGSQRISAGARVRAGMLGDGAAVPEGREAPGAGGLVSGTVAGRLRVSDMWLELAAGGGLTGRTFAPTAELAVGWTWINGSFELGPSARYVRVVSTDAMDAFGSAGLVLVGIDVTIGKRRPPARVRDRVEAQPAAAPAVELQVEEPMPVERDDDRVVDTEVTCVRDLDGCQLPEGVEVLNDRIILDEQVLFDFDRARVRTAGRQLVRAVVELWKTNPTWKRITIEGHTDVRGTDAYNVKLSEMRAERVRALMVELGAPGAIDTAGFGRARPREVGAGEQAHRRNRRVEFVIDRSVP